MITIENNGWLYGWFDVDDNLLLYLEDENLAGPDGLKADHCSRISEIVHKVQKSKGQKSNEQFFVQEEFKIKNKLLFI